MKEGQIASLAAALLLGVGGADPASAQAFDNAAVLKLRAAGLGDEAIVAKIRTSPCAYDLSTDQMIVLSRGGLSDRVITAMVDRCSGSDRAQGQSASANPTMAHRPGIYLEKQGSRDLVMLRPTVASGLHISGNGSILFPFKATLTIPQASAQLRVPSQRPVFYFYFDPSNEQVGDFGTVGTAAAQSPNEFSLVHFRDDHGTRQFQVGKVKGNGANIGIDPHNAISTSVSEVGDGSFKVEVAAPLEPGQYGFVLPGERGRYRIYDFAIAAAAP